MLLTPPICPPSQIEGSPSISAPPPKTPVGQGAAAGGSRQAVVGIQAFWLHVVNCGGKRARGALSAATAGIEAQNGTGRVLGGGISPPFRPRGTHTGSCRGCWSPSWTGGWSGRPCGGPPCARRGSGTSCPHCPASTPCIWGGGHGERPLRPAGGWRWRRTSTALLLDPFPPSHPPHVSPGGLLHPLCPPPKGLRRSTEHTEAAQRGQTFALVMY